MKPSKRKTDASIYKEAAKLICNGFGPRYSCWAVNYVVSGGEHIAGFISHRRADYRLRYETAIGLRNVIFTNKNQRILALCFMAAMVEAGDA